MALPASGPISMSQVNAELGISPVTTQISLNDAAVRTLFQKASGPIAMSDGYGKSNFGNSIVYNASGYSYDSEATWTVPANVSLIWVKMWGAGGIGGAGGAGGGGGYLEGYISVTPGQTVSVNVGGYKGYDADNTCECDAEGYPSRWPNNTGFGGCAAAVKYNGTANTYMIVGGGGGGSEGAGGGGGGTTGVTGATGFNAGGNGGSDTAGGTGAYNGTFHSGWIPGAGATDRNAVACTDCENGQACGAGGGGGGDGWGGGGMGYTSYNGCDYPHGGGGGGGSSNYLGSWSTVTNSQASGTTPPQTGNADYGNGAGVGGSSGFGSSGNSRVIIRY